jgi:hypothetical protein
MSAEPAQMELAGMPPAEVSKLSESQRLRREIERFQRVDSESGPLIAPVVAARVLHVSRTRLTQLMESGRLSRWYFFGHPHVALPEVRDYRDAPRRRGGRPSVAA